MIDFTIYQICTKSLTGKDMCIDWRRGGGCSIFATSIVSRHVIHCRNCAASTCLLLQVETSKRKIQSSASLYVRSRWKESRIYNLYVLYFCCYLLVVESNPSGQKEKVDELNFMFFLS